MQGGGSFKFPDSDPLHGLAHRVTTRAGSLLLWNQELAHGSRPNSSRSWRVAQFVRGVREDGLSPARREARARAVWARLGAAGLGGAVTARGHQLFGTAALAASASGGG